MKKDIESWKANNEFALKLEIKNFNDKTLGPLRKISYNIRADLNTFIYKFVEYDGILITMQLLDECKRKENWDILHVCCKILEEVLKYQVGISYIWEKPKKYLFVFYELLKINE